LEEQGALKLIARINQQPVVVALFRFGDRRDQTRSAAKALASGVVFRRTGGIEAADRLPPVVEIVGVKNGQRVVRSRQRQQSGPGR
jgi:hypothetical protein